MKALILAICLLTACNSYGIASPGDSAKVIVTIEQLRKAVDGLLHYEVCKEEVAALILRSDECDSAQIAADKVIEDLNDQIGNRQDVIGDLQGIIHKSDSIILNDVAILKLTKKKKNKERWVWAAGGAAFGVMVALIPKFISLSK